MTEDSSTLEWLIVGGGIHGVHIAARLLGASRVTPERLRVVDPGDRLLDRWRTCTDTVGMTHLRSPSVHHLDLHSQSLLHFAAVRQPEEPGLFAGPYNRPSLALFNAHCDHVVETFGLDQLHIRDRAMTGTADRNGVEVHLSSGRTISARNVILAVGAGEQPEWPDWAPRSHPRIQHVFDPEFDGWPSSPETVVVVGGGVSAAQLALRLRREGHEVQIVSRHALREHRFDSEPGWLGPKFMKGFSRVRDVDRRRALITEARHRGSVPPAVGLALCGAIAKNQIHWHEDEVESLDTGPGGLAVHLAHQGELNADRILLATGFAPERPGEEFVDSLIASASLPCAACGYPVVDPALRWHPRLRVLGPLAELELGPVARNIAGARRAGDRLVDTTK